MTEDKKKCNFIVHLPPILDINEYHLKGISKLTYDVHKSKWHPIDIEFYCPVAPSVEQKIFDNIIVPKLKVMPDFQIDTINSYGEVVSRMTISGATIDSIDFDLYDYTSNGSQTIVMKISPKYCILNL
jgi:hypothetical protein